MYRISCDQHFPAWRFRIVVAADDPDRDCRAAHFPAARADRYGSQNVDCWIAVEHPSEHGVAVAVGRAVGIEEKIIGNVDEKLAGRAVWIARARHCDRAKRVAESGHGGALQRDRCLGGGLVGDLPG